MVSYLTLLMIALIVAFFWISSGLFLATRDEEAQATAANVAVPAEQLQIAPEPTVEALPEADERLKGKARTEYGVLGSAAAWLAVVLMVWSRKRRHSTLATAAGASATPSVGAGH